MEKIPTVEVCVCERECVCERKRQKERQKERHTAHTDTQTHRHSHTPEPVGLVLLQQRPGSALHGAWKLFVGVSNRHHEPQGRC